MKSKTIQGINDGAQAVKNGVLQDVDSLKHSAKSAQDSAESYIVDNPKKALAIAAGAGVIVGAAATMILKNSGKKVESLSE